MNRRSEPRPWLRPFLSLAYLVAVGLFAFFALRSDWSDIVDAFGRVEFGALLAAAACSTIALAFGALSFRALLVGLGENVGIGGAFRIYFVSQLGKYLPGSVWPAVVQVRLGSELGIARSANLASFVLGLMLSIAVGLTTGFVVLSIVEPSRWLVPATAAVGLCGLGFALHPLWRPIVDRLPAVLRSRLPPEPPSRRSLAEAVALLVLSWCFHGLQIAALSHSIGLDVSDLVLRSIGSFAVAYAAGVLFVIAPAGAGVREAVLASVLASGSLALVTAIVLLSRIILLGVDVVLGLLGAGFSGPFQRSGMPAERN